MKKYILLFLMNLFYFSASLAQNYTYQTNNIINIPCVTPAQVLISLSAYANAGFSTNDSVHYFVYFSDGTADSAYFHILQNDSVFCNIYHTYQFAGQYNPIIKIVWPNLHTDYIQANSIFLSNGCTRVSGHIYDDVNSNCMYDSLIDKPIPFVTLKVYTFDSLVLKYFYSDINGYYTGALISDSNYTISPVLSSLFTADCVSNIVVNFMPNGNPINANWSFTCNGLPEISTWVYGRRFRPGFNPIMNTIAVVENNCQISPTSYHETLDLDSLSTYNSSITNSNPSQITTEQLTWNTTVNPFINGWRNETLLNLSLDAQIGDLAYFKYRIAPLPGETDTMNNTDLHIHAIINSEDPNFIEPKPAEGLMNNGQLLKYMIHFQNTGNDTAYNVYIIDTLDINLELETFHVLGSSHPMSVQYLSNNIIKFNFYNINLLDSANHPEESDGYVLYKIYPKNNLAIGTQIKNIAYIYFDINAPIITNKTLHTIGLNVGNKKIQEDKFVAFPNPSSNLVYLSNTAKNDCIILTDITGKIVFNSKINTEKTIDISHLNNGLYFIYKETKSGISSCKLIKN